MSEPFGGSHLTFSGYSQALRMSMQEEQARRNAEAVAAPQVLEPFVVDSALSSNLHLAADVSMDEDEEAQLAAALALSRREDDAMADDEEEEIQQAIRLSSADADNDNQKKS
jgi:hypothetical protein